MVEIRRILCPVDFSDYSRRALDMRSRLPDGTSRRSRPSTCSRQLPSLLRVPAPIIFQPIVLTAVDRENYSPIRGLHRSGEAPGVAIEAVVREGNTAAEIVDQATSMNADLLVIGTHGRSGLRAAALGSVAEKVLRRLVARSDRAAEASRRRAFWPDPLQADPLRAGFLRVFNDGVEVCVVTRTEADGGLTLVHVLGAESWGKSELERKT